MMTLDAITPDAVVRRSPEHAKVVLLRIPALTAVVLNYPENLLQTHNGYGLYVPRLAKSGGQQRSSEVFLIGRHLAHRQAHALPEFVHCYLGVTGNEVPVHSLVGVEGNCHSNALIGIESS